MCDHTGPAHREGAVYTLSMYVQCIGYGSTLYIGIAYISSFSLTELFTCIYTCLHDSSVFQDNTYMYMIFSKPLQLTYTTVCMYVYLGCWCFIVLSMYMYMYVYVYTCT